MPEFWWWRIHPGPPWKRVGVIHLPEWMSYLADRDTRTDKSMVTFPGHIEGTVSRKDVYDSGRIFTRTKDRGVSELLGAYVEANFKPFTRRPLGYEKRPIGSMYCLFIRTLEAKAGSARNWLITPPCYQFADLRAPAFQITSPDQHGPPQLFVQPDVQRQTGEILQGRDPGEWMDVDLRSPGCAGIVNDVEVALDSFIARDGVADSRFMLPPGRGELGTAPSPPPRLKVQRSIDGNEVDIALRRKLDQFGPPRR